MIECYLFILIVIVLLILAFLYDQSKKKIEIVHKLPEERDTREKKADRYCPDCGRAIPFDAIICPYCGRKFKDIFPTNENVKTEKLVEEIEKVQEEKKMKSCLSCGYENKPTSKFCKECGTELGE